MGISIDGRNYADRTASAPADSDDQSARNFRAELEKQTSGKAQYAAAQEFARDAHEKYNQGHGGGSTIGSWWYNDRDYLSPAQQKLFDQAQHLSDVERAGDVSGAAVAGRSALDTASMGLTELAHDATTFEMGDQSWANNARENRENREAAERLHPWASRAGTAAGVAAWLAVGWESGAAKAAVSGGGAALRAAGAGAAMGAVNGATHSDGSVGEAAAGAGIGVVVGAATGGIGAKATEIAAPYVSKLASTLASAELRGGLHPLEQKALANISGGSANWEAEAEAATTAASRGKGAGQGGVNGGSGEAAGSGGQATAHGPEPTVPPSQPANPGGTRAEFPVAAVNEPAATASGNAGRPAAGPGAARSRTEADVVNGDALAPSGQQLANTGGNAVGNNDTARAGGVTGGRAPAGNAASPGGANVSGPHASAPTQAAATAATRRLTTKEIGDLAETQAERDLMAQGYSTIYKVQNKSGNGVDLVGVNANGGTKTVEVKANGAGLNRDQANMGGRRYAESRLRDAANRTGRYKTLTRTQRKDARKARVAIRNDSNPKYEVWKYDVDQNGNVTRHRVGNWDYAPGKKPARLSFGQPPQNNVGVGQPQVRPPATGPPAPATPPVQPSP